MRKSSLLLCTRIHAVVHIAFSVYECAYSFVVHGCLLEA
uniref:Uncharacterized protein n=1 Tax=Rhizophora mucronata TaxID=61149 RepID=A0A2P2PC74_RHIMU